MTQIFVANPIAPVIRSRPLRPPWPNLGPMKPDTTGNWLAVPRAPFVLELRRLIQVIGRRRAPEAILSFDVNRLLVHVGGAEFSVPASGHWSGEARVAVPGLRALARVPPRFDPVEIRFARGQLRIENFSMACRWQLPGTAILEVPVDRSLATTLRLMQQHGPDDLEQSGLARLVAEAVREKQRRIAAAARQLAPLGVSPADVAALVATRLRG